MFNTVIISWVSGNYKTGNGGVNVVSTSGATFYITGVQLEVGTQATSFDFRDYGRELILCQRYFQSMTLGNGGGGTYGPVGFARNNVTICCPQFLYYTPMRTAPTVSITNNSAQVMIQDGSTVSPSSIGSSIISAYGFSYEVAMGSGVLTNGRAYGWYGGSIVYNSSAEL